MCTLNLKFAYQLKWKISIGTRVCNTQNTHNTVQDYTSFHEPGKSQRSWKKKQPTNQPTNTNLEMAPRLELQDKNSSYHKNAPVSNYEHS